MKIGDRVRYRGVRTDWEGFTGTISHIADNGRCKVKFDQTYGTPPVDYGTGILLDNLELIMPTIDTTKPLLIYTASGFKPGPVPFITKTSEGHILVGKPASGAPGTDFQWIIFTDQGEPVRCSAGDITLGGWGGALRLKNAPVVKTYSEVINSGQHVISLNITETDGELTKVEWVK